MAAIICEAPIARISFVDRDRQWFKAKKGPGAREAPRHISVCAHAMLQPAGVFIVSDTTLDPRFADYPPVAGGPPLLFYAGAPLISPDGYPLGTLCVRDYQPRELTERQCFALQALANQVMAHLELMRIHRAQAELIGELEAARHALATLALTDPLTGLFNRRAFEQRFDQEVSLIQRGAPPAALMLIDLDHFKTVNDTLGHQAGDKIIVRFTELCRKAFRQADVIARWGGDEFIVMLPRTHVGEAQLVAERLHQDLANVPMLDDVSPLLYSTASIGLCPMTGSSTVDDCLHCADRLLYLAKEQGRSCTVSE